MIKKGNGKRIEEYRNITLLPTAYKIYAKVKEEIEGKQIVPRIR